MSCSDGVVAALIGVLLLRAVWRRFLVPGAGCPGDEVEEAMRLAALADRRPEDRDTPRLQPAPPSDSGVHASP